MKSFFEISAAIFALIGVMVGVWGTFLLTQYTHTLGWWAFNWSIILMFFRKLVGKDEKNQRIRMVLAALSNTKVEKKPESLLGLHWVFFGFILQTIGAVLAVAAALSPESLPK